MQIPTAPGSSFTVWAKPNASATKLLGYNKARGAFEISLAAVADKGKANDALLKFLKKEYGIVCEIVAGNTTRKKRLRVL